MTKKTPYFDRGTPPLKDRPGVYEVISSKLVGSYFSYYDGKSFRGMLD